MLALELLRSLVHPFTWRLAWRNTGRHARRTAIVVTAVAVGLAGILLTMAVNYGMVVQMVQTAIATELGHLQIHGRGWEDDPDLGTRLSTGPRGPAPLLRELPGVRAWAPRVRSEGLVHSPRASAGVRVVGVDPVREAEVTRIAGSLVAGAWLDGERRVLLGERLADRLHVGVGDKVVLSAQDVNADLTAEAYRVGGLFRTASRELDEGAVLLPLAESQRLLGLDGTVSEYVVVAEDDEAVARLREVLARRLGASAEVRTWEELRPLLVAMIDVMDQTGWYVYGAVFVAMAFGIANVLLMSVMERLREIGILTAIGMPPGRLVGGVVAESLLLCAAGVALGLGVGFGLVALLHEGIDLSRFSEGLTAYGIGTRIVPVLRTDDLWVPVVVATATAVLASLWPAVRAVRIRPAEAVRRV